MPSCLSRFPPAGRFRSTLTGQRQNSSTRRRLGDTPMTLPSPTEADPDLAVPFAGPMPSGLLHINPVTGLSTDYLNHFAEALMVLDALRTVPECVADLRAW